MAAPVRGKTLARGTAAARPVPCVCPRCSTRLRPQRTGRFRCGSCQATLDLWITAAAVRDHQPAAASEVRPAAAAEDQPPCTAHPQNASVVACSRCGDFICEVCRIRIEGKELCPRCFEHGVDKAELAVVRRQFRSPEMALGLSLLAIPVTCLAWYVAPFVALFGVGMGIHALMKIHRQPSLGGKRKAVAGIIVGSTVFLLFVCLFLMLILGFTEAIRRR